MGKKRLKSDNAILKAFGAKLAAVREDRGMTQEQVADLAEMSRSYLAGVETGRHNIGVAKVIRIAEAMRVPAAALFDDATRKRRR